MQALRSAPEGISTPDLGSRGRLVHPAHRRGSCRRGRKVIFEILISPLLLAELQRALAYPKLRRHFPKRDAEAAVQWFAGAARHENDPEGQPALRSNDPGDDYLISLAAEHRAALVSGDRDLLALKSRIPVFSSREFLELLDD